MIKKWWQKISALIVLGFLLIVIINSSWFLKLFYPFPHRELVLEYSSEYGVDPFLVLALMRTESRFYARANSPAGAKGLMQIMPETGSWIAKQLQMPDFTEDKLYQPQYNIPMGIWYLVYLDSVFSGDLIKVLAAYNAGEHNVKKWLKEGTWSGRQQDLEQIPYAETREYIDKVLFDYHIYKRLYKKQHLAILAGIDVFDSRVLYHEIKKLISGGLE